jgi:plastocyanin
MFALISTILISHSRTGCGGAKAILRNKIKSPKGRGLFPFFFGNKMRVTSSHQHEIMKLTMENFKVAAITAVFSLWMAGVHSALGATTNVVVGFSGDHFSPTNVLISTGDTVIWTWAGNNHSTTSGTNGAPGDDNGVPSGSWGSGVNNTPHSFTNTFTSAGVFSYYCSVHFSIGMTGQVFVASSSVPPIIAITNPPPGTVYAAPANVTIQAGVTNGSSAVTNVEFLAGLNIIANETAGPFSTTANNLAAGNYTLTAIASDNSGLSATNSVAITVVTPVTVSLTNVFRLLGTNFQFSYPANIGLNYVVQRSTNLINWVSLVTNTAASNPAVYVDVSATNGLNFYRVGRLPNP